MAVNGCVSCYGFDVLNDKAARLLTWLWAQGRAAEMILGAKGIDVKSLAVPARVGTKKHFTACDKIICAARIYAMNTGTLCPVELCDQLIGLEGKRVEVLDSHGERRRFWVGRSTGWLPNHLEIATSRSSGGPAVMGAPFKSITIIA
jgi:hypothetical protein